MAMDYQVLLIEGIALLRGVFGCLKLHIDQLYLVPA